MFDMRGFDVVDEQEEEIGSPSSSSFSEESTNSCDSSLDDLVDDGVSSSPSLPFPSLDNSQLEKEFDPIFRMSHLMKELPVKKGLSKHFQGKSQSFTSLSNVKSLEDLAKPPAGRMMGGKRTIKPSKSYATGLDASPKPLSPKGCNSKIISKNKPSNSKGKRNHHSHYRPPTHQHGSGNLSNQTLLFA